MRIHVKLNVGDIKVDRELNGIDADQVVEQAKQLTADAVRARGGFVNRMKAKAIRGMSNMAFACEAKKLYEKEKKFTASGAPKTPEEFITWATSQGIVEVLE